MMPAESTGSGTRTSFALLSGLLLGLSYPPIPAGILAAVAFVPLFVALRPVDRYWPALRISYLAFLALNVVTLYWTGGFSHGQDLYMMVAGVLLLLVHPFFFYPPVAAWVFIRRRFGFRTSLLMFPFLWVSFEYLHASTQIGFPWLTLGNTQTYDRTLIQFIALTGVYGLSFWLLWLNVLAYLLYDGFIARRWRPLSRQGLVLLGAIAVLYVLPRIYGLVVLREEPARPATEVRVGIVQPDIDPFEKWEGNAAKQLEALQSLTSSFARARAELVLWPETAVPFFVLAPQNFMTLESIRRQVDTLGISLLTGIPDIRFYRSDEPFPKSSKTGRDGRRYDTFNSSMLLQPHDSSVQRYAKIILVPFAERVPFSEALSFLNAMQWNFGLGGWGIGADTTVFHFRTAAADTVTFSNMICYESMYPSLVAAFVRKGASFLTVITNDSWWGRTSGAYQHERAAVLRAVENRRWIVQCANGGISCVVDPYGTIVESTGMFERTTRTWSVEPLSALTPYTRLGDWFADLCTMLGAFFLAATCGKIVYTRIRNRDSREAVVGEGNEQKS